MKILRPPSRSESKTIAPSGSTAVGVVVVVGAVVAVVVGAGVGVGTSGVGGGGGSGRRDGDGGRSVSSPDDCRLDAARAEDRQVARGTRCGEGRQGGDG